MNQLDRYVSPQLLNAIRATYSDLPYHNFNHALSVTNRTMRNSHFKLSPSLWQHALVLAALLHDADHQGSLAEGDDWVNINRALSIAKRILHQFKAEFGTSYPFLIQAVPCLIEVTNSNVDYLPRFLIKTAEQRRALNIIRDADMGQTLMGTSIWRDALSEELGIPITLESTLEWVENQEFYTPSGKRQVADFKAMVKDYLYGNGTRPVKFNW